jgi:hypothetical protein
MFTRATGHYPEPHHPISLRSILTLTSQLRLSLSSGPSFWLSHQNLALIPCFSSLCYVPCPSHQLNHSNYISTPMVSPPYRGGGV